MSDEAEDVRIKLVPLDALLLDPNNPRLIEDPQWPRVSDEEIPKSRVQRETAELLLGERAEKIRWLLQSLLELGWVDAEPVRVRELASGKLVVLDGNRRLIALRRLGEDRGSAVVDEIRVAVDVEPTRRDVLLAHGARHIWGRHGWPDFCEVVWREEMNIWPGESEPIPTPERRYSKLALDLCLAYQKSQWGREFRSWMFLIFTRVLTFHALRKWLGFGPEEPADDKNLQRFFSWISAGSAHGDDGPRAEPALKFSQDLFKLADLVSSPEALDLIDTLGDIEGAWLVWTRRGDERSAHTVDSAQKALVELRRVIEAAGEEPVEPTSERPWPVIFTDSWPSLTSLRIARYRGLSEVSLDGLTRINLLVGVNNAGKTSVLEAIYLLCRRSDPRGLLDSIRARVRTDPEALPPPRLVGLLPGGASISGTLASGAGVEVDHVPSDEPANDSTELATFLTSLRIEARGPAETQVSLTELHSNRPRRTRLVEGSRAWLAPAILHSPFSLADWKMLKDCHARSAETGVKAVIIDFIKQHVDPDVEDVDFVDDGRFLVQRSAGGALDLSSFGEGMQRIFQIGLLFAAHAHGVVLIDEFENALHTSVLTSFSRMIQELAVRFDVQVFLTTHSDEALQAFLVNDYRTEDVTTFLLKKDGGRISVRRFDGKSHKRAVEFAGVDVRRL